MPLQACFLTIMLVEGDTNLSFIHSCNPAKWHTCGCKTNIFQTSRSGSLKYIGFTTAGVPLGGITGVNEAQISVALHQHYSKETSLQGHLPFVISEKILMEAENLTDALKILNDSHVNSSWAFVVADGKTKDGFIYESAPKSHGIKRLSE